MSAEEIFRGSRKKDKNISMNIFIFEGVRPKPPKSYEGYEYMFKCSEEYGSWGKPKKKGRENYE